MDWFWVLSSAGRRCPRPRKVAAVPHDPQGKSSQRMLQTNSGGKTLGTCASAESELCQGRKVPFPEVAGSFWSEVPLTEVLVCRMQSPLLKPCQQYQMLNFPTLRHCLAVRSCSSALPFTRAALEGLCVILPGFHGSYRGRLWVHSILGPRAGCRVAEGRNVL